jgi:hypothetical protein
MLSFAVLELGMMENDASVLLVTTDATVRLGKRQRRLGVHRVFVKVRKNG